MTDQLNYRQSLLMAAWYMDRVLDRLAWQELLCDYFQAGRLCAGAAALNRYNRMVTLPAKAVGLGGLRRRIAWWPAPVAEQEVAR